MPDRRAGTDTTLALETLRGRAAELPSWLQAHTGRVVAEGRRLAQLHEVDPSRVQAAAWGHDLYRHLDDGALLRAAQGAAARRPRPGDAGGDPLPRRTRPSRPRPSGILHGPCRGSRAGRSGRGTGAVDRRGGARGDPLPHHGPSGHEPGRADALPGPTSWSPPRSRPTPDWPASVSWRSTIPPESRCWPSSIVASGYALRVERRRVLHPPCWPWRRGTGRCPRRRVRSEGAGR